MSNRMFWNLLDDALLLEFVTWLRLQYPIIFKNLVEQFLVFKESPPSTA